MQDQYAQPKDYEYDQDRYLNVNSKRLAAFVIDSILILFLTFLFVVMTFFIGVIFWGTLIVIISFAYRALSLALYSATPGMRLFGMRIEYENGAELDGKGAILHTLGFWFSCFLPILQLVSIVLMLTDQKNRGLTDHILGTCAVRVLKN